MLGYALSVKLNIFPAASADKPLIFAGCEKCSGRPAPEQAITGSFV